MANWPLHLEGLEFIAPDYHRDRTPERNLVKLWEYRGEMYSARALAALPECAVSKTAIFYRLYSGWNAERAVNEPPLRRRGI